jgi:hypothetical protein
MAKRVDLDDEFDIHPFAFAQHDEAVEDRFPILVAREIVVGDEEAVDALRGVAADDLLDIVRRAPPRFAALDIDDGAEAALERAAAAGVEARQMAGGALNALHRQDRHRCDFEARQIVHVIVERLQRAVPRVAQHLIEPPLGLAGEERDAQRLCLAQLGRHVGQHRQRARDMEAADADLHAALAQPARDVHRARILVRLHADQPDHAAVGARDEARDALGADAGVGLVEGRDDDINIVAKDAALGAIDGEAVKRGEGVRRDRGAQPLDDVTVVVVMRRFDQHQGKGLALCLRSHPPAPSKSPQDYA